MGLNLQWGGKEGCQGGTLIAAGCSLQRQSGHLFFCVTSAEDTRTTCAPVSLATAAVLPTP